jgi:hypothetical protein
METQALAFKLARDDGYSYPNSLHYLLASTIVEGERARREGEAILAESREFCRSLGEPEPARTAPNRAIRDRETS